MDLRAFRCGAGSDRASRREAPLVKQAMCADKDSCRNARLTPAALRMQALSELLRWAEHMGGWDAPCWMETQRAFEAALQG